MHWGPISLTTMIVLSTLASGGSVFEFDGKEWNSNGGKTRAFEKIRGVACLIAPAETPMDRLAKILPRIYQSRSTAVKFQLRGQVTGVTLNRPAPGFQQAMEHMGHGIGVPLVFATTGPEASFLSAFNQAGNQGDSQARLAPGPEPAAQDLCRRRQGLRNQPLGPALGRGRHETAACRRCSQRPCPGRNQQGHLRGSGRGELILLKRPELTSVPAPAPRAGHPESGWWIRRAVGRVAAGPG